MKTILGFSSDFWDLLEANVGVGGQDCQGVVKHCMKEIQSKISDNPTEDLVNINTLLTTMNEHLSQNNFEAFKEDSQKVKIIIKDITS